MLGSTGSVGGGGDLSSEGETPESIGRYRVLDTLGAGSMGVVYRCRDEELERDVAVKVLRRRFAGDPEYRRRFRREARAVASLTHPCVVRIHGIEEGDDDDAPVFIVMEYVAGMSADRLVRECGAVDLERAATWIRDAARGLEAAHREHLIHRDVKPSNILVTPDDHAHIVDFGLAKRLDADNTLTQEGIVLGTPHYISPEQGRGREVDHRADIYSLGAAFYHLITGEPPFDAGSHISVIVAHVNEAPAAPHELVPDIPESATRVIFRMLAKSPEDRYPTYAELVEDLDALIAGDELPSGGELEMELPTPPASSRPRPFSRLGLAAALTLVFLLGAAVFAVITSDASARPRDFATELGRSYSVDAQGRDRVLLDFAGLTDVPGDLLRVATGGRGAAPGVRDGRFYWSGAAPIAFNLDFEQVDTAELIFDMPTRDDSSSRTQARGDIAFALVHPSGDRHRILIVRLRPGDKSEQDLVLAYERGRRLELEPPRYARITGEGRLIELRQNPSITRGRLRLQLQFTTSAEGTELQADITHLRPGGGGRAHRVAVTLPGSQWASGVPSLFSASCEAPDSFEVGIERLLMVGNLSTETSLEDVPWRS